MTCPNCGKPLSTVTTYYTFSPINVTICENVECKYITQDAEDEEGPYSWEFIMYD